MRLEAANERKCRETLFTGACAVGRRGALWYAVRWSGFVNQSLIPAPHQVASKFVELLLKENLLFDIYASTRRVFFGVILGIAAAVPVGFLLGWYRPARTLADPMINFFRALPPIALIPLVIVYFGVDEVAKTRHPVLRVLLLRRHRDV